MDMNFETMRFRRIDGFLKVIQGKRILVVGDLMLDHYIYGNADRISPEAPVPIVRQTHDRTFLGGAGNVVRNLRALRCQPFLIAGIGDDDPGQQLITTLDNQAVPFCPVSDLSGGNRITTVKTRILGNNRQVCRLDRETIEPWTDDYSELMIEQFDRWANGDDWKIPHPIRDADKLFHAIIISDYDKGFITEPIIDTLRQWAKGEKIPIVADPKYRNFLRYKGFTSLTPNRAELIKAASERYSSDVHKHSVFELSELVCRGLELDRLLVTHGPGGMYLHSGHGDEMVYLPSESQKLSDVTGAGDTVTAAYTAALTTICSHYTYDHHNAADFASFCAGIAVDNLGTHAPNTHEIYARMQYLDNRGLDDGN